MKSQSNPTPYTWAVFSQSQLVSFTNMVQSLSKDLGPCLMYTGNAVASGPNVDVEMGPPYQRGSLRQRAASWSRFTLSAAKRAATLPGDPLLLFVTNPPLLPHVAWLCRQLKGTRYALLVWDIYPEHIVSSQLLAERHPLVRLWSSLNRQALASAEQVITIGDGMAEQLYRQLGGKQPRRPIRVIPNCADLNEIKPIPKHENPLAEEYRQLGRLSVMYAGNMGMTHEFSALVDAVCALANDPAMSFVFMGDGSGHAQVASRLKGIPNVVLHPRENASRFPSAIALADINIVCQAPGTEHLSLPSKVYSALAAGSAIVALTTPGSDLGRLVLDHEVGLVAASNDSNAIVEALRKLADDPARLQRARANALAVAREKFNYTTVFEAWRETLEPLVVPSRNAGATH